MKALIVKLKKAFEVDDIRWAVGGSNLLSFYDITDLVHDLDLIIAIEDHEKASSILSSMGQAIEVEKKSEYLTEKFSRFCVDGLEIDVMSNFKIKYNKGVFNFLLDDDMVPRVIIHHCEIAVTSLEQWLIAYMLMEKREAKVKMIEDYFIKTQNLNKALLKKYISPSFPVAITSRLENLL